MPSTVLIVDDSSTVRTSLAEALEGAPTSGTRSGDPSRGQGSPAKPDAEARQRAQLDMLLENLSEGVIIADADGHVHLLNRAACTIFGLANAESARAELSSLEAFDLDGRPLRIEECPLARATRGEWFTDYELLYVLSSGERRRMVFTGASVKDATGEVAMASVVLRDVTEVRRLAQQRREYLALISHDLRGPLSNILMSISTLKALMTKAATPSGVVVAERAERNVRRMTTMLEDLSEATNFEIQGVELRRVTCDLLELVTGVVDGMDVSAARRVAIESENTPPFLVSADRSRLERVIVNLLTNALKYSAGDSPVEVRLARDEQTVQVDVVDRGIGIAPEHLEMLFNRYYRTEAGKASAGGSGLGLYIVRLIVEAHGGHIDVSSEVGKGSRFRLVLPAQASPP